MAAADGANVPTGADPQEPGAPIRVLYVEDDERLAQLTRKYLEKHGLVVTWVADGEAGVAAAARQHFDVALLDLMLPKIDGITVCRQLRTRTDLPIIMLTARDEEADKVLGLESGADDYLAKPYSTRELLARIRAQVRRSRGGAGPAAAKVIRVGALLLEPGAMAASLDGKPLSLTAYEFLLLRVLAERAGRVLTREQLLDLVKGSAEEAFDRSIDVHISRLRQKLESDPRHPRLLRTVRGTGYMLAAGDSP
jgi:two-component system OmpR family response regulator